jgi:enoyl-[acyl-carrier protein] reductase II
MSDIIDLLKCKYPVIQGAMGNICNPELVAAVSEAGGLGLLATAFAPDPEFVRTQIQDTKKLTQKPFGANLQVMNPHTPKIAQILADEGIGIATVSGGSPKTLIPFLHDRGIKVLVVVPTVAVAKKAEASGADAIIAEGSESGGIQGFNGVSTMVLVPAVVDAVKIPVIAAGGIGDSRGYRAALALGARGVQVGTRFIASFECIAHVNFKNTLIEYDDTGTCLINVGAFQVRALRTPLAEAITRGEKSPQIGFGGASQEASWIKGDLEAGVLPAGEVTGLIHNICSVKEIIEEMMMGNI